MKTKVVFEFDLPKEFKHFRMPKALLDRLTDLLDKQDERGKLSTRERREAEALVELSENLTFLKLRAMIASKN